MNTKTAEKTEIAHEAPPAGANALTTTIAPRVDAFISAMLPPKSAKQLWSGLPEHISPDLFRRNLYNALMANPALMDYAPVLVYREVSKAAAVGLLLDPMLGEAYIIEAYNGKTKRKEPQLRVGYKGMMKLARQSGNVAGLWCHEVRENDTVEADLGYPKKYSHRPVLFGERGPIIGYTAVIAYKDNSFDFEPMTLKECLDIRDRSDAWKVSEGGTKFKTPWSTDQGEMCKKTVFNRLMKRQDKSPEMRQAIEIENEAEFPHMIDSEPVRVIRAPTPPPAGDNETTQSRDLSSERVKKPPRDRSKAPEPTAEPAKPAEPEQPMSTKELLAWIDRKFSEVTPDLLSVSPDIMQNIWDKEVEPKLVGKFPPDVDAAQAIYRQHEKRLEP